MIWCSKGYNRSGQVGASIGALYTATVLVSSEAAQQLGFLFGTEKRQTQLFLLFDRGRDRSRRRLFGFYQMRWLGCSTVDWSGGISFLKLRLASASGSSNDLLQTSSAGRPNQLLITVILSSTFDFALFGYIPQVTTSKTTSERKVRSMQPSLLSLELISHERYSPAIFNAVVVTTFSMR